MALNHSISLSPIESAEILFMLGIEDFDLDTENNTVTVYSDGRRRILGTKPINDLFEIDWP